jgi:hypothetical protein
MLNAQYPLDRTAYLLVDPYNDFLLVHAAHELNGPTFAHAILTTDELIASLN